MDVACEAGNCYLSRVPEQIEYYNR